jgi:hypothetical protein
LEVETVLRGSLDTFALPDVLTLLAGTAKSGELQVTGPAGDGRVWLDRGLVVAAESGSAQDPIGAVVQLLRLEEGEFAFDGDVEPSDPGPGVAVDELLAAAAEQLAEWRDIEAVLPSPAAVMSLVAEAPKGGVRLSAEQWRAVVAVGEGRPIEDVLAALGVDDLAASRVLKGLVEAGLAEVGAYEAPAPSDRYEEPVAELSPLEVAEPVSAAPRSDLVRHLSSLGALAAAAEEEADAREHGDETVEDVAGEDDEEVAAAAPSAVQASAPPGEPVNRGTLLKFLSSVRT